MKRFTRSGIALAMMFCVAAAVTTAQAEEQPAAAQTVSGKLVIPENDRGVEADFEHGNFLLYENVVYPRVTMPDDVKAKSPEDQRDWYTEWLQSDEGKAHTAKVTELRRNQKRHTFTVKKDGSFSIEGVKPGTYTMSVQVFASAEDQQSRKAAAQFHKQSIEVGGAAVALGDLEMEIDRTLRVGDVAPSFEVKTVDGKDLKLADFKGKYVLVDFWAVWCGPCRGETPHLKSAYETFGANENFEIIGLSLDKEAQKPIDYAKEHELGWVNGFLGEWNSDSVAKSYGVRGIPSIFLIGPDGKIVATGLRGKRISEEIAKHVKPANVN